MDSNHRRRKPADLQSAPFGHSGICPYITKRTLFLTKSSQSELYPDDFRSHIISTSWRKTHSTHPWASLLSDSNQRPRDYKSRALANWAKEAMLLFCGCKGSDFFLTHKLFVVKSGTHCFLWDLILVLSPYIISPTKGSISRFIGVVKAF